MLEGTNSTAVSSDIQGYWNCVFSCKKGDGSLKYKLLPILVKALLSFPHDNAAWWEGI